MRLIYGEVICTDPERVGVIYNPVPPSRFCSRTPENVGVGEIVPIFTEPEKTPVAGARDILMPEVLLTTNPPVGLRVSCADVDELRIPPAKVIIP